MMKRRDSECVQQGLRDARSGGEVVGTKVA